MQDHSNALVRLIVGGFGLDVDTVTDIGETLEGGVVATVTLKSGESYRISIRRMT